MDSLSKLERAYQADPGNLNVLAKLTREQRRLGWTYEGKSIPEWLESLSLDKPWHERSKGVWRLGGLGTKASFGVPALLQLLSKDPSVTVQSRILQVLGKIRCEASIPTLIEAAKTAAPGIRWVACKALGELGPKAKLAGPVLWKNTQESNDESLFVSSLEAYAKVAPKESLRTFRSILESGDPGRIRSALRVLPALKENARPLEATLRELVKAGGELGALAEDVLEEGPEDL
ncbi:MAG: HEAT repeat domain-containing protein [Planctomycetota bacterium]|nr:HEAT repeat domain-containing protein [Planctomycetota bacterium]